MDILGAKFEDGHSGTSSFENIRKNWCLCQYDVFEKIYFFANIDEMWDGNNKQTLRCYGNSESGPLSCTDKFFFLLFLTLQQILVSSITCELINRLIIKYLQVSLFSLVCYSAY